jgi:hypothetical protein
MWTSPGPSGIATPETVVNLTTSRDISGPLCRGLDEAPKLALLTLHLADMLKASFDGARHGT